MYFHHFYFLFDNIYILRKINNRSHYVNDPNHITTNIYIQNDTTQLTYTCMHSFFATSLKSISNKTEDFVQHMTFQETCTHTQRILKTCIHGEIVDRNIEVSFY